MPDYSVYHIDLDTPQPGGGRGESPRAAFTKVNELMDAVGQDLETVAEVASNAIPLSQKGQPFGVVPLTEDSMIPEEFLPPIPSGPAVGTPDYWPLRTSIPAGQIPQDGQTVLRSLYPDLTAMVIAGTLPVVAEATWQSDPTQRGKYTLGDGSTTIRLPDLNGKSAGSFGAVVLRGDGSLSAGTGGLIQRDALQNITGSVGNVYRAGAAGNVGAVGATQVNTTPAQLGTSGASPGDTVRITFDASLVARTATETRGLNVTGVWTVHAFGAVVNPGSVDAAQLASDYAVLNAAIQTLNGQMAQAFGVGQTLQNVLANRAWGATYTNSTGRPILALIRGDLTTSNGNIAANVNGAFCGQSTHPTSGAAVGLTLVIPAGATYVCAASGATLSSWLEYR